MGKNYIRCSSSTSSAIWSDARRVPANVRSAGWSAEAAGALSHRCLAPLFPCGRGLRQSRGLSASRSGTHQVCDPSAGEPRPAREDRLSADPARPTAAKRIAQFPLSAQKLGRSRAGPSLRPNGIRANFIRTSASSSRTYISCECQQPVDSR
jgi:hypothetical protein